MIRFVALLVIPSCAITTTTVRECPPQKVVYVERHNPAVARYMADCITGPGTRLADVGYWQEKPPYYIACVGAVDALGMDADGDGDVDLADWSAWSKTAKK